MLILKNKILDLEYILYQYTNTDTVFPTCFNIFYDDLDLSLQLTIRYSHLDTLNIKIRPSFQKI